MINFNFLDLAPAEFEELARDIVQVRENIELESFKSGKDKGIDFRYRNEDHYIIVQAKRYANYPDLKQELVRKEIAKVKKLKPTRYILVTSVDLSVAQKDEILHLFEGLPLKSGDVVAKKDLNNLLGMTKYARVRKTHYKLWLTSIDGFEDSLESLIYRKEENFAKIEWDTIRRESKYYVQNKSFLEALDRIEETRAVLISGTPGSGKTTLGYALISYFHAKEEYTLVPVWNAEQLMGGLKEGKKQIFFYDDFLGDINFEEFRKKDETSLLSKFITKIGRSKDKILILTTREYVFRQAQLNHPEYEKDFYTLSKCIVDPETYTHFIRAKILYNHLYFSRLRASQILALTSGRNYDRIIKHPNYTPRLISSFIEDATKEDYEDGEQFFQKFEYRLDHPRDYLRNIYDKLSPASRFFLVVLFSVNDPVYLVHFRPAFDAAVKLYIKKFNDLTVSPDTWERVLKELSSTFIKLDPGLFYGLLLRFQNPSIKDFLLDYLRGKDDLIEIIIESAVYFNQLTFAFSTMPQPIADYGSDYPIYENKIVLTGKLYTLYRDSLLEKFDGLTLSTIESSDFESRNTYFTTTDQLLTTKLLSLAHIFGMEDETVRRFVIDKFETILSDYEKTGKKILEPRAMAAFPDLVEAIQPYVPIDAAKLLEAFYKSITYAEEYVYLHDLGTLLPEAFTRLLQANIKHLASDIKELLIEDIDYYYEDGMDYEVDHLLDDVYPEIFDRYGLVKTEEFTRELYSLVDMTTPTKKEREEEKAKRKKARIEIEKSKKDTDELFSSLEKVYSPKKFTSKKELNAYLNTLSAEYDKETIGKVKKEKFLPGIEFLNDEVLVTLLLTYFKRYPSIPEQQAIFWERMFDIMYEQLPAGLNMGKEQLLAGLSIVALIVYASDKREFDEGQIRNAGWKPWAFDSLDAAFPDSLYHLSPFLFKDGNWLQFPTRSFELYLVAIGIGRLDEEEKMRLYNGPEEGMKVSPFDGDNFIEVWRMLLHTDFAAFAGKYVLPKLKGLLQSLDFSNDRSLALSVIKNTYNRWTFELDEQGFLHCIGTGTLGIIDLIDTLNLELDIFYSDIYPFDSPEAYENELFDRCKAYIAANSDRSEPGHFIFFPQDDPQFLDILDELGLVDYLVRGARQLKAKIEELETQLKSY